ncbi:MAG: 3-phosphoshikimate 1-carboxyvinyltransferase [Promethearchaeota archaeon]|nr:MAG: 3-phosphoshikimate 1-carboxyvinyltransferase [Candidatus Lokiarchaeota archaeon]
MDLSISPSILRLSGTIIPPGSKSYSHRAFILAAFANGKTILKNPLTSGDVKITIDILSKLGIKIEERKDRNYEIYGGKRIRNISEDIIDCGNSGTSIRIFSALSLIIDGGLRLKGEFLRRNRPLKPLLKALEELGAVYSLSEKKLIIQRKEEKCGDIKIRGNISSQFITSLLILCSIIKCKNKDFLSLQITTPIVSYPYVKITQNILKEYGIKIQEEKDNSRFLEYKVKTGQKPKAIKYPVPSDFSSAAFIIAAATLTPYDSKVIVKNLDFEDPQGDKRIIEILKKMGAYIQKDMENKKVVCYGNLQKNSLNGIEIDCKNIPDLFPILSVVGAFASGKTVLYNAGNLRLKESDRIKIMARELTKMGINVEESTDKLIVFHANEIKGAKFEHNGDHRIAMACSIAALFANSKSLIENIDIVKDSYPNFIIDLKKLGASTLKLK